MCLSGVSHSSSVSTQDYGANSTCSNGTPQKAKNNSVNGALAHLSKTDGLNTKAEGFGNKKMPPELWPQVFKYLPIREIFKAREISREVGACAEDFLTGQEVLTGEGINNLNTLELAAMKKVQQQLSEQKCNVNQAQFKENPNYRISGWALLAKIAAGTEQSQEVSVDALLDAGSQRNSDCNARKIIKFLLNAGANINISNFDGEMPIDLYLKNMVNLMLKLSSSTQDANQVV